VRVYERVYERESPCVLMWVGVGVGKHVLLVSLHERENKYVRMCASTCIWVWVWVYVSVVIQVCVCVCVQLWVMMDWKVASVCDRSLGMRMKEETHDRTGDRYKQSREREREN
jgi:hypothetical protein